MATTPPRTRRLAALAGGIVLTAAGLVAGLAIAAQPAAAAPAHRPATCQTFTLGWLTATGHEANAQMTFCGTGARSALTCEGKTAPEPGAVFDCYELRRGG